MLVLKGENFYAKTAETLQKIQVFLGLPYHELTVLSRGTRSRYEPLDPAPRRRLETFFEPHNRRLYDLLGRDFGW